MRLPRCLRHFPAAVRTHRTAGELGLGFGSKQCSASLDFSIAFASAVASAAFLASVGLCFEAVASTWVKCASWA